MAEHWATCDDDGNFVPIADDDARVDNLNRAMSEGRPVYCASDPVVSDSDAPPTDWDGWTPVGATDDGWQFSRDYRPPIVRRILGPIARAFAHLNH